VLMGHSAGGVFTQLMLDRGYGAVGVAINSAPTEGVPVVPLSQLKSTFPVLRTVGRKKAAGFTLEQWRYVFTNTFTEEESRALYERGRLGAVPRCAAAALPARRNRRPRAARPDAGRARMSLPPRPAAPRVPCRQPGHHLLHTAAAVGETRRRQLTTDRIHHRDSDRPLVRGNSHELMCHSGTSGNSVKDRTCRMRGVGTALLRLAGQAPFRPTPTPPPHDAPGIS
jgi:hypothetical protein